MFELDHPQYAALKADLKAGAKSLETLTLNFCDAFERPSNGLILIAIDSESLADH